MPFPLTVREHMLRLFGHLVLHVVFRSREGSDPARRFETVLWFGPEKKKELPRRVVFFRSRASALAGLRPLVRCVVSHAGQCPFARVLTACHVRQDEYHRVFGGWLPDDTGSRVKKPRLDALLSSSCRSVARMQRPRFSCSRDAWRHVVSEKKKDILRSRMSARETTVRFRGRGVSKYRVHFAVFDVLQALYRSPGDHV